MAAATGRPRREVYARALLAREAAANEPPRATRRRAERRGRDGASCCCLWHLRLKGYRILARRYRSPAGEIDLIARRGGTLAAIEVKARADFERRPRRCMRRQRSRIIARGRAFPGAPPRSCHARGRFDVMLVTPRRWPRHLVDAWRDE